MCDDPAKFEERGNVGTSGGRSRETREARTKLRDNLLVNSQQYESNYKLRAIIQPYLNSNKSWIVNDFRNDTKDSDPMVVDSIGKSEVNGNGKGARAQGRTGAQEHRSKGAKEQRQRSESRQKR